MKDIADGYIRPLKTAMRTVSTPPSALTVTFDMGWVSRGHFYICP
jgi:hypothetical protein